MRRQSSFDRSVLQQIGIFRTMDSDQLAVVAQLLKEQKYPAGQNLFHQGDDGGCLYLIIGGRVRIYLNSQDGREATVRIFSAGSSVGELSVLDGQPRSASAVALDDVTTLVLYREDLLKLLREHFAIVERLLAMLVERVRYTTNYSEQLAFLSAPGRVASALLQLASGSTPPIRLMLTQQDLASLAGTTREWANRALKGFADAGLVDVSRGAITLLDKAGLEQRVV